MPYTYTLRGKTYIENENAVIYPCEYKFKGHGPHQIELIFEFKEKDKRPSIDEKDKYERIKQEAFDYLDLNKDGILSKQEINEFKKTRNRCLEYKKIVEYNINNTGFWGKISGKFEYEMNQLRKKYENDLKKYNGQKLRWCY